VEGAGEGDVCGCVTSEEKAPRLRGWASPFVYPTALFIRDYLLSHGEGYAQEIWRELKKTRKGQHVCFKRNYVYVLKKLGLIEESRREPVPGQPNWHERRYYSIVQGKEDLGDEWTNPQKVWREPDGGENVLAELRSRNGELYAFEKMLEEDKSRA